MAVQEAVPEGTAQAWEQILVTVRASLQSTLTFDTWFRPIVPLKVEPNQVLLAVPNPFFVDWIHEYHLRTLTEACAAVLGTRPEVRFVARAVTPSEPRPQPATPRGEAPGPAPAGSAAPGWLSSQLNPRHTFETFVVGSGSELTHAACRAVADSPGRAYNPLFIFGGSGLGKTHLLHAIGHQTKHNFPASRVAYLPAERFTNEMVYAIRQNQTLAFRNKYRNVDVLLIDDIQFLSGKEGTQEEFFYTFNALRDAHRQIVVTADKPPKDIPKLEERLLSRFNQGLVTDIRPPDLETRLAILRKRCELEGNGLRLPDDVALLLADRIRSNVRDLEGSLVRLLAIASLARREITVELAEEALRDYVHPEPDRLSPERILSLVAERFAVTPEQLCGRRRTQGIVLPRQVAMYLMRQLTELSLVEIGQALGGRDHTTVIYACEKVAQCMQNDPAFAERVNALVSTAAAG
jgi:chromosomal replication initiator protein